LDLKTDRQSAIRNGFEQEFDITCSEMTLANYYEPNICTLSGGSHRLARFSRIERLEAKQIDEVVASH
jgi:hypothetical protein